ncbi:hypothetical protein GOV04_00980 [Candidatus Woesearchaeota archaeon]|nr:hypothetical protein [Candidatus Woesearchaeota archaeon]
MHDQIIAQQIIQVANQHGVVKHALIELGELANIDEAHLRETLEKMTDWHVDIITKDGIIDCACGHKGKPTINKRYHESIDYECPVCNTKMPKIIDGNQILLKEVEVE